MDAAKKVSVKLTPAGGSVDDLITIEGSGFGKERGTGFVNVVGKRAEIASWSDTKIVAKVPKNVNKSGEIEVGYGNFIGVAAFIFEKRLVSLT